MSEMEASTQEIEWVCRVIPTEVECFGDRVQGSGAEFGSLQGMTREKLTSILCLAWFSAGPAVVGTLTAAWLVRSGAEALPAMWVLIPAVTALLGLALLPTTLVALLGGYLLGMESLLFTAGTYLPAALLGYGLGRSLRPEGLLAWLYQRRGFADTLERLKAGGWKTVFWVRLSPAVPFGIGNLAMAWAGMPLRAVLIGSLPGMLPRTVLATYAGHQAHSLAEAVQGGQGVGGLVLPLTLLVLATGGLWWQGRREVESGK